MVKLLGVRLMNDGPVSANVQILSDLAPSPASQVRPLGRWETGLWIPFAQRTSVFPTSFPGTPSARCPCGRGQTRTSAVD
jgi:hypothetical protein